MRSDDFIRQLSHGDAANMVAAFGLILLFCFAL